MERPLLLIIRIGLMLILALPLLVMSDPLPATYFPFIVGKALYGRVLIEIVFGLWIILISAYPKYRPPKSWILIAFSVFLIGSMVAALAGVSLNRSLWSTYERMQGVIDLVHWFAFALVTVSVMRGFSSWRNFINANVAVSVVVALLGISQRYGFRVLPYLAERERIDSTLGNPVFVGAYMLVALVMALALLAYSFESRHQNSGSSVDSTKNRRRVNKPQRFHEWRMGSEWLWRIFWTTAVLLDFIVLLMAGARGALIGLAVMIAVVATVFIIKAFCKGREEGPHEALRYLVRGPNGWLKMGTLVALFVMVAGAVTLGVARDSTFVQRVADSNRMVAQLAAFGTGEDSSSVRLHSVKMGLVGFTQRPLTGWGPENFSVPYDRNLKAADGHYWESVDHAHNKVVEELTTKGLVGFLPFAAMWLLVAWAYVKTLRRPGLRAWHFTLLMGAATLGYFVQNLFLFDTPATALQIFVLLGFAAALETNLASDVGLTGRDLPKASIRETVDGKRSNARYASAYATLMMWIWHVDIFKKLLLVWQLWHRIKTDKRLVNAFDRVGRLWAAPEVHIPIVLAAIVLAIVFLNYRPYAAAHSVIGLGMSHQTWSQRMEAHDKFINTFPALGNYPRVMMIEELDLSWNRMAEEDKEIAIRFVIQEFEKGRQAEPQSWRIYLAAGNFFMKASANNAWMLDLSRDLIEEAVRLAPERVEVNYALIRQLLVEGDIDGAQTTINWYLELNPDAHFHLRELIKLTLPDPDENSPTD